MRPGLHEVIHLLAHPGVWKFNARNSFGQFTVARRWGWLGSRTKQPLQASRAWSAVGYAGWLQRVRRCRGRVCLLGRAAGASLVSVRLCRWLPGRGASSFFLWRMMHRACMARCLARLSSQMKGPGVKPHSDGRRHSIGSTACASLLPVQCRWCHQRLGGTPAEDSLLYQDLAAVGLHAWPAPPLEQRLRCMLCVRPTRSRAQCAICPCT